MCRKSSSVRFTPSQLWGATLIMDPLIACIREELASQASKETRERFQRFFKEEVRCYGVRTGPVVALARRYWKDIRSREKEEIFDLCVELYRSGYCEEAFIVSTWVRLMKNRYEPSDLDIFERWIDAYISNWAACDEFCKHSVGGLIGRFPGKVVELDRWARSGNLWLRRAAAVSR